MPVKRQDAATVLQLMKQPATLNPDSRTKMDRLLGVFQSELFQALLDIQEFYEVTVSECGRSAPQRSLPKVGMGFIRLRQRPLHFPPPQTLPVFSLGVQHPKGHVQQPQISRSHPPDLSGGRPFLNTGG
ncbi:disks large 4 [Crotalus adamanteus]|uniref:Disks large 4 n=1 Tax=Crotalus adamanteus TaxID=8729 RepID=A0AAW1B9B2_CROAD